jgi:bifunctional non-homologous end joining protein LigD
LQRRIHTSRPSPALLAAVPVTFLAFDLLRIGRRSLLRNPYQQRRALLEGLGLRGTGIEVPPTFPGDAAVVLTASLDQGLEGVVLKRSGSPYTPGRRSGSWLKIRHIRTLDVIIGGWVPGSGYRSAVAGQSSSASPARQGWSTAAASAAGSPRPP